MKLAVVLFALLPFAFSVPVEKRFLTFPNLLNTQFIRQEVQKILDKLGSDATEQQCETTCHTNFAVDENHLIHTVCNPLCRSFQNLVNLWGLRPHVQPSEQKRFLVEFDPFVDVNFVKKVIHNTLDKFGSDPSQQQCETVCHNVKAADQSSVDCTFLCQSFPSLVKLFVFQPHHEASAAAPVQKRFLDFGISNLLNTQFIRQEVQKILDKLGSDATEQQCEDTCHSNFAVDQSHLIHTFCNPICRSFQSLVNFFGLRPHLPILGSAPVQKRFLDFGFSHLIDIPFIRQEVQKILNKLGSDASEQQCEDTCHNNFAVDQSHLIHTVCNPLCRSFQSLVSFFGLLPHHEASAAAPVQKRFLNLGIGNLLNTQFIRQEVQKILDKLGSDATEQQCEDTCHSNFAVDENHLIHTFCNPICRSFQSLVNFFGLRPHLPILGSAPVQKRFLDFGFSHLIDIPFIRQEVQKILNKLGSDASEQQCEDTCHNNFAVDQSHLIHTVCNPLCRSFQSLVSFFGLLPHHEASAAAPVQKRFLNLGIGNLLNTQFIRQEVQKILDKLGSDATEQQCEDTCHSNFAVDENHLIHTFCNPICRSFQSLVNFFGLRPHLPILGSAPVQKRFLDFGFSHLIDIPFIRQEVQKILNKLGSDASEQQCEDTCHNNFAVDQSHLIHTVCNPLCRSFQSLVSFFGLLPHHEASTAAPVQKRFLDLGIGNVLNVQFIRQEVQKILNKLGSDATEQQCEDSCHNNFAVDQSHLIHTVCNPICRSFQSLVSFFGLLPHHEASAAAPVQKRFLDFGFSNLIDIPFIRQEVQKILNKLGSDATEQQCEDTCHNNFAVDQSHLIHTVCNPLCRSFQTLVSFFGLLPHHQVSTPAPSAN